MANQIKKDIIKDAYASKEVKYYRDLAKKAADSKKGIEEITKNLSNLSGKELENAIKYSPSAWISLPSSLYL